MALVAVCIGLAAATAQPAPGQVAAAPPLTTEDFRAFQGTRFPMQVGTLDIVADCQPASGQPTIDYTASGPATGPYPGTYQETGRATIAGSNPAARQAVVAFDAQFTIDSTVGRVTGTKQLDTSQPAVPPANTGNCFQIVSNRDAFFDVNATYTATITTATGTCTTQGSATVSLSEQVRPNQPQFDGRSFLEFFTTGTPPVCVTGCPPNDDEDGDGLIDSRELLLFTLLGVADSDFDGIKDGNDDANGNGRSDEDEDDDDGCPDRDSDGDGTDDEDEDD
jgi:hypothetical protein